MRHPCQFADPYQAVSQRLVLRSGLLIPRELLSYTHEDRGALEVGLWRIMVSTLGSDLPVPSGTQVLETAFVRIYGLVGLGGSVLSDAIQERLHRDDRFCISYRSIPHQSWDVSQCNQMNIQYLVMVVSRTRQGKSNRSKYDDFLGRPARAHVEP